MRKTPHRDPRRSLDDGPATLPPPPGDEADPFTLKVALSRGALDTGRLDEAGQQARDALERAGSDAERREALVLLADVAHATREGEVAWLERALALGEDAALLARLSRLLDGDRAREASERAITLLRQAFDEPDDGATALPVFLPLSADDDSWPLALQRPQALLARSRGEVVATDEATLYAQSLFGPLDDLRCGCGALEGPRFFGQRCARCLVEVTFNEARARRCGHIALANELVHPHAYRGRQSLVATLLDITRHDLDAVMRGELLAITTDLRTRRPNRPDERPLLVDRQRFEDLCEMYHDVDAISGPHGVARMLRSLDPDALVDVVESDLRARHSTEQREALERRKKAAIEVRDTVGGAVGLTLLHLPVLPPASTIAPRRPVPPLSASALAPRYLAVIEANEALKNALERWAPELVALDLELALQRAVDDLFDAVAEASRR